MPEPEQIRATIAWEPDDEVQAHFANHLLITTDGTSAYLRFYQVLPPAVVSPEEARQVESIKGRHVVTLAVNPSDLKNILTAIQRILAHLAETAEKLE